jgi:Rieske Fe-S protein
MVRYWLLSLPTEGSTVTRRIVERDGPRPNDEVVELNAGQLRLRADRTDWHTVARQATAAPGRPIRFTTVGVVGYLTVTELAVVAVVGVCSRCGCLLQVASDRGSLRCPAGGTQYRPDGRVLHPRGHYRPSPLTRLHTRLAGGRLQALVPQCAPSFPRQIVAASALLDGE